MFMLSAKALSARTEVGSHEDAQPAAANAPTRTPPARIVAATVALTLVFGLCASANAQNAVEPAHPIVFMQIPVQNGGENWGDCTDDFLAAPPEGSRIVRLEPGETEPRPSGSGSSPDETEPRPSGSGSSPDETELRPSGTGSSPPTILTPDFVAAGRPNVSFDGQRMLFVGRRSNQDRKSVV